MTNLESHLPTQDKEFKPAVDAAALESVSVKENGSKEHDSLVKEVGDQKRETRLRGLLEEIKANPNSHLVHPGRRDELLELYASSPTATAAFNEFINGKKEKAPTKQMDIQSSPDQVRKQVEANRADAPTPVSIRETKQDWAA